MDDDGCRLPTLVYLAREKRPQCPHNFKAGSMNALVVPILQSDNNSLFKEKKEITTDKFISSSNPTYVTKCDVRGLLK